MTIKIYKPSELSNAEYQALPQISGSSLHVILSESPAQFRFCEPEEDRKALDFGIYSHAMILEPERFAQQYAKDFDASAYEQILVTNADLQGWLRDRGAKVSGTKAELIERILSTGEQVFIAELEATKYRDQHQGREFINPIDYAKLEQMRAAIFADKEVADMLANSAAEYSLVSDEFKVRPDIITGGGGLVNYKTCRTCHPQRFGKNAYDYGYIMKAALEWDMFKAAYGQEPAFYCLLAQQKHSPFIHKPWMLGKDIIAIGRQQYKEAIRIYRICKEQNSWPAFGGVEYLVLPEFITKQYEV